MARRLARETGLARIVLAGGVWHNDLLRELLLELPGEIILPPPELRDDRGIAAGQLAVAQLRRENA